MDNVYRDISRLTMICELPLAQEQFSLSLRVKDLCTYFFTRFARNLSGVFKDFTSSQIADFDNRHHGKLKLLFIHPTFSLKGVIVPIPKGMLNSYRNTLSQLTTLLAQVHPDQLTSDIDKIIAVVKSGQWQTQDVADYSQTECQSAKLALGKMFGKTGLTHSTAPFVFPSKSDLPFLHHQLLDLTQHCYPIVVKLNSQLVSLEKAVTTKTFSDPDRVFLTRYLMTLAYRLTIFAAIMEHIQDMEAAFVSCLTIFLQSM